ncbi:hypothetical protein NLJ89_g2249 [Agrocybe chaxingu]|uniref:DUF6533 domain-containing protein n=1 Tax=Agrocybe chaxingu TaxID=84603 RepID=A0A9W8MYS7_9AGAR|nr:hypothetical protein NLJ89_g2249 [Agrocybe chaxingu]
MVAQAPAIASISNEEYIRLYKGGLIPLKVCLASLVWVLHDYLVTLEDEVRYIWPQKRSFGRFMFLWIRYYTIGLVAAFNGVLFAISIGLFLWIMIVNAMNRGRLIATAIHLPIPGCPAINGGTQWAQWIPAAAFELVLVEALVIPLAFLVVSRDDGAHNLAPNRSSDVYPGEVRTREEKEMRRGQNPSSSSWW